MTKDGGDTVEVEVKVYFEYRRFGEGLWKRMVLALQAELSFLQNHLTIMEIRQLPPIPPTQRVPTSIVFSVADLPTVVGIALATSSMPATFDPSFHFDPATAQSSWAVYQRVMMDPR
ncbi:hypothetical protein Ahy_B04g071707 [Arachis hypogaea]|uniref:Uncharacterized protein n=1 Tax=Arachis hypogaea TaxID=3818 RepID=A0A444ZLE3_ARAHY|nr:hypothetical protein Ahy_B04g071707 [Arachis hypogaea]